MSVSVIIHDCLFGEEGVQNWNLFVHAALDLLACFRIIRFDGKYNKYNTQLCCPHSDLYYESPLSKFNYRYISLI